MRAGCRFLALTALGGLVGAGLAGCETPQQVVQQKEDLLSAAGFVIRPADTPKREHALHTLPPDKFVRHDHDGHVIWVMADPLVCNCLYIGDQKAFDAYRHEVFTRQIADERQMTASMYQDQFDWGGWNWGPWGPGWWAGPGWW
jgi:hypothetical protein